MARGRKTVGRGPSNGGSRQSGVPKGPYGGAGIKGTQGARNTSSGKGAGKAKNNV